MGLFEKAFTLLGPWNWWVLGMVLAMIEIAAPGTFFIWFAIAAILTGVIALLFDLSLQVELLIFVGLAVIAAFVGRRLYGKASDDSAADQLGNRPSRQIGRLAILQTPLKSGSGHIKLDDTLWQAEGPDLPAGTEVRITGFRDGRFQVEPGESIS